MPGVLERLRDEAKAKGYILRLVQVTPTLRLESEGKPPIQVSFPFLEDESSDDYSAKVWKHVHGIEESDKSKAAKRPAASPPSSDLADKAKQMGWPEEVVDEVVGKASDPHYAGILDKMSKTLRSSVFPLVSPDDIDLEAAENKLGK